jgi:hypothetical protein
MADLLNEAMTHDPPTQPVTRRVGDGGVREGAPPHHALPMLCSSTARAVLATTLMVADVATMGVTAAGVDR